MRVTKYQIAVIIFVLSSFIYMAISVYNMSSKKADASPNEEIKSKVSTDVEINSTKNYRYVPDDSMFVCYSPTPVPKVMPKIGQGVGQNMLAHSNASFTHLVVAYIGGWGNIENSNIDFTKMNYINYAFLGVSKDCNILPFQGTDDANLNYLKRIKTEYPHLKVLISLGGYNARYNNFHSEFRNIISSDENSATFAQNCLNYLKKYDLDGITFDWEFPSRKDRTNYTRMIKALRDVFNAEQKQTGKKYFISIEVIGGGYEFIDFPECSKYADWLNALIYDFTDSKANRKHNANLYHYNSEMFGNSGGYSCDDYIKDMIKNGWPAERLTFGVSLHGSSNFIGSPSYTKIKSNYIDKNNFKRYWDDQAKMPMLFNGNYFISYEDPESLKYKCEYVKNNNMAGMVYWEYFIDGTKELINTISDSFSKQ